jgi:hypothetical protein
MALVTLAITPAAHAVDPNFTTTVSAPASITFNTVERPTFASYTFTITNNKLNAVSGVYLRGTTSVIGTAQTAPFVVTASDATCSAPVSPTSVQCSLGSVPAGGSVVGGRDFRGAECRHEHLVGLE